MTFPFEEVGQTIRELAAELGAYITYGITKPGNLVRMTVHNGRQPIQLDILCVGKSLVDGNVESLNMYLPLYVVNSMITYEGDEMKVVNLLGTGYEKSAHEHPPIQIRPEYACIPFSPQNLILLQEMATSIKASNKRYTAYILLKGCMRKKISAVTLMCLVTMSDEIHVSNAFELLYSVHVNMTMIAGLQQGIVSFENIELLQYLAPRHADDGCLHILSQFQLEQITEALPVLEEFLTSVGIMDEYGNMSQTDPVSDKMDGICSDLTALFHSSCNGETPDFMHYVNQIIVK